MKGTEKGLEEAKKCVVDFKLMLTKKDLEGNQKEADLKLKVQELKVRDAKLRKKYQLLTALVAQFKEHVKESEELKAELQLKEDEISRLFDDVECQFDERADSTLDAIKSRLPDLDYSLLDQPLDQGPASIASNSGMSAPGSSAPAPEIASSVPRSSSPPQASSFPGSSCPPAASPVLGSSSPPAAP